jgi:hypothetical protein
VCLSATSCTIGEDSGIVAIEDIVEKGASCGFVYLSLRGILVENAIESKCLVLYSLAVGNDAPGELLDRVVLGRIEYPRGTECQ